MLVQSKSQKIKFVNHFYVGIVNFGTNVLVLFWYLWNNICLGLAVFNDSLFVSSHSFILNSSAFINKSGSVLWGLARLLSVLKSKVSSA